MIIIKGVESGTDVICYKEITNPKQDETRKIIEKYKQYPIKCQVHYYYFHNFLKV